MSEKIINTIIEGGKATAGPPLGPALGPLGVNAGQVVAKLNEATKGFSGMKLPVRVIVDTSTKSFKIEVGSPPTSELIKKEAGVEKGAGSKDAKAGNISMETAVKISKQKSNSLGKSLKDTLKEVVGTCNSMGITVGGKEPREIIQDINAGKHDSMLVG